MHETHTEENAPLSTQESGATTKPTLRRMKCHTCTKLFKQNKPWQKFCSNRCRQDWHKYAGTLPAVLDYLATHLPGLVENEIERRVGSLKEQIEAAREDARSLTTDLQRAALELLNSRHGASKEGGNRKPQDAQHPAA